jgi:hypothetical protein
MLEKTTCENFCQKRPPTSGGTPWPGDTWHVPPGPVPAGPAAVAVAGSPAAILVADKVTWHKPDNKASE